VADVRAGFATAERFPRARGHYCLPPEEFFEEAPVADYSHMLILGHDHHVDGRIVLEALRREFPGYIGVIGSQTKRQEFRSRCQEQGIQPGDFDRKVTCPVGLPIQAETPEEIAVSILAQVIQEYRSTTPKSAAAR
jgi:xanthine dehydrogenase accessory factor